MVGRVTHIKQSPENPGRFSPGFALGFGQPTDPPVTGLELERASVPADERAPTSASQRFLSLVPIVGRTVISCNRPASGSSIVFAAVDGSAPPVCRPRNGLFRGTVSPDVSISYQLRKFLITYQAHLARSTAWIAPWGACNGRRIGPNGLHDAMSVARIRFPCRCGAWNMSFVRNQDSSCSALLGSSARRPSSRSAGTTQLRIACADGGLDLGIVDTSFPKDQVSTKAAQLHSNLPAPATLSVLSPPAQSAPPLAASSLRFRSLVENTVLAGGRPYRDCSDFFHKSSIDNFSAALLVAVRNGGRCNRCFSTVIKVDCWHPSRISGR